MSGAWHFWVDRGGTFTDLIGRRPDGRLVTCKLLSEHPGQYDDAVLAGIRQLLEVPPEAALPVDRIASVRLGTTVANNALLERRGEPLLLIITRGFADLLRIGYQNRPDLFALNIQLPAMLYTEVMEADERLLASGEVLQALDEDAARADLRRARAAGLRSYAIVLMRGYRHPVHENRRAELAA